MFLTIAKGDGKKCRVDVRDGSGNLVRQCQERLESIADWRRVAKALEVPVDLVASLASRILAGEQTVTGEIPPPVTSAPVETHVETFAVLVRGENEPDDAATVFQDANPLESLRQALALFSPRESAVVIKWAGTEKLCALDLDFHESLREHRPVAEDVARYAASVSPKPEYAWLTHGRGVRLIFTASDGFTADELAGVAAISARNYWPAATVELKDVTYHPAHVRVRGSVAESCGPVLHEGQRVDVDAIRNLFEPREASEDQIAEFLERKGWTIGQRYEHEQCPISPSNHGGRRPVEVTSQGVRCYYCASRRASGFLSFAQLCGEAIDADLAACVRGMCHWEHARDFIDARLGVTGPVAECLYRACLKAYHGVEDERVPIVFAAGKRIVRVGREWLKPSGESYVLRSGAVLRALPAVLIPGPKGWTPCAERVEALSQTHDLTDLGYPPLNRIWACRIRSQFLPMASSRSVFRVFPTRDYVDPDTVRFRPAYLDDSQRQMSLMQARREIEYLLPGVNWPAVELLIAAKGCVEGEGVGVPPLIGITGPSSAGKSATVEIAAMICGDVVSETRYSTDRERIMQAVLAAKDVGSYCVFNELFKQGAAAGRKSFLESLDLFLNLTPNVSVHKMYVGPVRLGTLPVLIWTESDLENAVAEDRQIARRTVHVDLVGTVDWVKSLAAAGVDTFGQIRRHSESLAHAANVILSHVIDSHFRDSPRSFFDLAKRIGFDALEARQLESLAPLRDLFAAVCTSPELSPTSADGKRWGVAGWRACRVDDQTQLANAWREVADESGVKSRRAASEDWRRLLGASVPVKLEVRSHGRNVAIRFVGTLPSGRSVYNADIPRDAVELESGEVPGVSGPRDAVPCGLAQSGQPSVSVAPIDAIAFASWLD